MATCLKNYGVKYPGSSQEFRNKCKETCLKKYGFSHSSQNPEISMKSASGSFKITDVVHWKSGDILKCRGSWEVKVVEYFNKYKIDFLWQASVFQIPKECLTTPKGNKTTYRPDCFLVKENLWIEIKGWYKRNELSKNKWLWFHETYPNSEMWDKKRIKSMGIKIR
jgi:hypothetical protein